jgi:competence protein ComEC
VFNKDASELPTLVQIMIETVCAQIMALPIIMVIFGELSLISVIANMIVVPFIPIAMAFTFIAGLSQILIAPIAAWVAIPAKVLLTSMTTIIELLARVPWALIEVNVSWFAAFAWYVSVLFALSIMYRHLSQNQKDKLAQTNHLE